MRQFKAFPLTWYGNLHEVRQSRFDYGAETVAPTHWLRQSNTRLRRKREQECRVLIALPKRSLPANAEQ